MDNKQTKKLTLKVGSNIRYSYIDCIGMKHTAISKVIDIFSYGVKVKTPFGLEYISYEDIMEIIQ